MRQLPFVLSLALKMALVSGGSLIPAVAFADDASHVEKNVTKSQQVEIGNIAYRAVARDGQSLLLQQTTAGKIQEYGIVFTTVGRNDRKDRNGSDSPKFKADKYNIHSIVIDNWSQKSLVGVLKVSVADKVQFWCFTIKHRQLDAMADAMFVKAEIHFLTEGVPADRVLALSGNTDPPAIAITIGALSETTPNVVENGKFFFDGCGHPETAATMQLNR